MTADKMIVFPSRTFLNRLTEQAQEYGFPTGSRDRLRADDFCHLQGHRPHHASADALGLRTIISCSEGRPW